MTTKPPGFKDISLKSFSITRLRILVEFAEKGSMLNREVVKLLGLSADTSASTLRRMVKDGELKKVRTLTDNGYAKYRYSLTIAGREQLQRVYRHATGREFFEPSVEVTVRSAVVSDSLFSRSSEIFAPVPIGPSLEHSVEDSRKLYMNNFRASVKLT